MDGEWRLYVDRNAPHNGERAQWQHWRYMRQPYFEAIDVIVESINRTFEQEDLTLIKTIEQILLNSMIESGYPIDTLGTCLD